MRNIGESATENEVKKGLAVFFVPDSRSKAFDLGIALPVQALLLEDIGDGQATPAGTRVQIIQAEILDNGDVLLGFTFADIQGICTLEGIAIESNEPVEPVSKADVRRLAYQLLDEAKRNLQQDKNLSPVAFIVKTDDAIRMAVSCEGAEEKKSAYARLVALAKAHRALAIITANDIYLSRENDNDDEYYDGKLAATGCLEAIWVTVSGPAITTWSIVSRYTRTGEKIVFDQDVESTGDTLNLLEGWASDHILPTN